MTWRRRCTGSQPIGTSELSALGPIRCCLTMKIHQITSLARTIFCFLDLGPVFEEYEADFGRTFVIGSDPAKLKMRDDVAKAFADGKRYFKEHPDITASELYAYAVSLAGKYGWEFGGSIAGHLIGQFPHERIAEDKITLYVHPKSNLRMTSTDEKGRLRHWILEIHFVDRRSQIGGFFEELLTVG